MVFFFSSSDKHLLLLLTALVRSLKDKFLTIISLMLEVWSAHFGASHCYVGTSVEVFPLRAAFSSVKKMFLPCKESHNFSQTDHITLVIWTWDWKWIWNLLKSYSVGKSFLSQNQTEIHLSSQYNWYFKNIYYKNTIFLITCSGVYLPVGLKSLNTHISAEEIRHICREKTRAQFLLKNCISMTLNFPHIFQNAKKITFPWST